MAPKTLRSSFSRRKSKKKTIPATEPKAPPPQAPRKPPALATTDPLSPGSSNVSPTARPPQNDRQIESEKPIDYFTHHKPSSPDNMSPAPAKVAFAIPSKDSMVRSESPPSSSASESTVVSPLDSSVSTGEQGAALSDSNGSEGGYSSRKSSVASVSFRGLHTSLPQGQARKTDAKRLRDSSPGPTRFQRRVRFSNVGVGEATKNNTPSFTVIVRHDGYHPKRRSRTFMVGIDENPYSNGALKWLLKEFVDDGDEIICVRVIEKDVRYVSEKKCEEEATSVMAKIQESSGAESRAINIVLEYAVGKLHATFQRLIQMYQPSMLIVGTRGRSLGGIQGLVNTRNSFSKYCLQYSPIPVVVVRPDEKRQKKKEKRSQDPDKRNYSKMLALNNGLHEADSENTSLYEVEDRISADEEAHQVATALGLPASFDPTLKPNKEASRLRAFSTASAISEASTAEPDEPGRVVATPIFAANSVANDSDEESGEEDEEGEGGFEVASGSQILESQKKDLLHKMEVGEAAALKQLKSRAAAEADEDDDEDDEEGGGVVEKESPAE